MDKMKVFEQVPDNPEFLEKNLHIDRKSAAIPAWTGQFPAKIRPIRWVFASDSAWCRL